MFFKHLRGDGLFGETNNQTGKQGPARIERGVIHPVRTIGRPVKNIVYSGIHLKEEVSYRGKSVGGCQIP